MTATETGTVTQADGAPLLAALLEDVSAIWLNGNQKVRDDLRKRVLHVLGAFRPPVRMPSRTSPPKDITDDDWFTEQAREFEAMNRDQLLFSARGWAFNAQQYAIRAAQDKAGTDAVYRDAHRRLGRVARLIGKKATVRTDDLRIALTDCEVCDRPGETLWRGRVVCKADYDEMVSRVPDSEG